MQWLIGILVVLVGLILLILLIGWMLPVNHKATAHGWFDSSPNEVWNAAINVREYETWRSGLKHLEVHEDGTWTETDAQNTTITFGVIEESKNEKLVVKILNDLPFGGTWTYKLTEEGNGCRVDITEDGQVYNVIFRFVSHFFMDQSATMKQYIQDLKHHLENT